jgi:tellurite resistance protein TehA-like permease
MSQDVGKAAPGLKSRVASLSPSYFALVMATGIMSVAAKAAGVYPLSIVLFAIAVIAFVCLLVLYSLRWVRHRERVREDARNPQRAFGYFTVVAGTSVAAVGFNNTLGLFWVFFVLLCIACAMWCVLGYAVPVLVLTQRQYESLLPAMNGSWFVWSVAASSLAVGFSLVASQLLSITGAAGFLAILFWSIGAILYCGIAVLMSLRLVKHRLHPEQLSPDYWVAMGALAISIVAGTGIVSMPETPFGDAVKPLILAAVVVEWSFAVWLVPLLVAAGFWRHVHHRVPLGYSPGLWSMVFPLGMFATATMKVGNIIGMPALYVFGASFFWIALAAWLVTFIGLLAAITKRPAKRPRF